MKLINNQILVKPTYTEKVGSIFIPENAESKKYATVSGEVLAMPESPVYCHGNPISLQVKVGFEIQVGDTVWFHFSCEGDAREEGKYIGDNFLVNYRDCYVTKRRGHIIPLNGFVLGKPVISDFLEQFPALKAIGFRNSDKFVDAHDYRNRCIVTHVGQLIPEYKHGIDNEVIQPDDPSIKPGDELLLTPYVGNELEKLDQTLIPGQPTYRFQRRDIIGKIVNEQIESISDRLLIKADSAEKKIGSIIIPDIAQKPTEVQTGTVLSRGYFVKEKYSKVYFLKSRAMKILFNGEEYFSARERHLLGSDTNSPLFAKLSV